MVPCIMMIEDWSAVVAMLHLLGDDDVVGNDSSGNRLVPTF